MFKRTLKFLECSGDNYLYTAVTIVKVYHDDHLPPTALQLAYCTLHRAARVDVSFLVSLACWRQVVCIVASERGHDLWLQGVPERNRGNFLRTIRSLQLFFQPLCIKV